MPPTEQRNAESPLAAVGRTLRLLVALVLITVMIVMFLRGINLI